MIAVVQRVSHARVEVSGVVVGQIQAGLLALVAVDQADFEEDVNWVANKMATLRIFRNGDRHFDLDVRQISGSILVVSNFTVAGQTRQGRRPSFDGAAGPEKGKELFDRLVEAIRRLDIPVETGQFGADMKVTSTNDGPATFIVDSAGRRETGEPRLESTTK
jgi:D-aminoacyl-tRNA deacylase